jgi:hypothetical protein
MSKRFGQRSKHASWAARSISFDIATTSEANGRCQPAGHIAATQSIAARTTKVAGTFHVP